MVQRKFKSNCDFKSDISKMDTFRESKIEEHEVHEQGGGEDQKEAGEREITLSMF